MPIDKELARRAKKSGGSAYVIEEGPSNISYYDPQTGQEFPGLPRDPWSLELYMRGGKHGNRPKLLPGRAPAELRAKWQEIKATLEDPAEEFMPEAERMIEDQEKKIVPHLDQSMLKLVQDLTEKVASLESTIKSQGTVSAPVEIPSPTPEEPRQLEMNLV